MKPNTHFASKLCVAALTAFLCLSPKAKAAADLFTAASAADQRNVRTVVDSDILKRRLVRVNFAELAREKRVGSKLHLNLFDDLSFDGTVQKVEQRSPNNYTLSGHLNGDALSAFTISLSAFTISICEDAAAINVRAGNGDFFQARFMQDGVYEVRQINPTKYPECGVTAEHAINLPVAAADGAPQRQSDSGDLIDVMVLYTPAAKNAAGGSNQIRSQIDVAVSESNTAYQQSQINTRIRLVYAGEVNYTESGDISTDLNRLTNVGDGSLDEAQGLRNSYGADLVSLWTENPSSCGMGWVMFGLSTNYATYGFSVVARDCATGYYSFAHELAHNMGCAHNYEEGGDGLYSYSHGWRFDGNSGNHYRTIMSYDVPSGSYYTRIQRFSNPNVLFDGVPTGVPSGDPNQADNAQTINSTAATVANFRASVLVSTNTPPGIIAAPQPQDVKLGETATFNVTASGTAPLYYFWRKGNSIIPGATATSYSVTNVQPHDATNYSVIVSNTFGSMASADVALTIDELGEGVDNPGFTWSDDNTTPWIKVTNPSHDGVDAAESGLIGDLGYSTLETPIVGPGTLTFWWKVSSEEGADYLDVMLDGNVLFEYGISGEVDWTKMTFNIPEGEHTWGWQYSKDFAFSDGQDKGWVDQVSYVAGSSLPVSSLSGTNKPFRVSFNGRAGADYSLQGSTNLINWVTLTNVLSSATNHVYIDTNSSTLPMRFYRVTSP